MANLLNINEWNVGGSTIGDWSANGNAAENNRFYAVDPWGGQSLIWEAKWDGTLTGTVPYDTAGEGESNGDGGFRSPLVRIDPNQKYRMSMWINRKVSGGGGNGYFGLYSYDSGQNNTNVIDISTAVSTGNPYFYVTSSPPTAAQFTENTWLLMLAFVYPNGYAGTTVDATSGLYKTNGTKHASISSEFKMTASVAYLTVRTYMYYCVTTADKTPFATTGDLSALARQYVMHPRIDLVDGSEPTIQQLIKGPFYQSMQVGNVGYFTLKGIL